MYSQRRKILSQNFFHSRKLVESLLRKSSIGKQDTVLEIGPGRGIITEQLLDRAGKVIAVELDTNLYFYLRKKFFYAQRNLTLINKDILAYKLPTYPYKIFANIPFSIEGKIVRQLLTASRPPQDCYLVMRKDLAERICAIKKECQFSIFYKPWFNFEIIHSFKKTDFEPYARMETVLLRFYPKQAPLLSSIYQKQYMMFVGQGFGGGKRLKYNLRNFLSYEQCRRLSLQYNFDRNASPSELNVEQWVGIFTWTLCGSSR